MVAPHEMELSEDVRYSRPLSTSPLWIFKICQAAKAGYLKAILNSSLKEILP